MTTTNGVREDRRPFPEAAEPFAREHRFTVADLIRLSADGYLPEMGRAELVDGRIEIMPADGDLHVYTLRMLADFFYAALAQHPPLRSACAILIKATLVLGEHRTREPDFMVTAPVPHDRLPQARDVKLIVEASVTSQTRDLVDKRRDYAEAGIPEYWVWDAEARELVIFRQPERGDYAEKQTLKEGAASPLFAPQIAMPLAALTPP